MLNTFLIVSMIVKIHFVCVYIYIQGALKFPLQTSRTCRGGWFDNILNWNPCPETYCFRATAIWKQTQPERTSRVSTSNSFAIHPPAELHDEGCLGRIMWCNWRLSYLSELVRASFMCLSVLEQHGWVHFCWIHRHDLSVWRSSR